MPTYSQRLEAAISAIEADALLRISQLQLTGRTGGGATNLDGLPTVGRAKPSLIFVVFPGEGFLVWELQTSSAATSATVVAALDDATVRWFQRL